MTPYSRVIVVEDDRDINRLISYHLRREGFRVDQFFDGSRAFKAILKNQYALAMVDIMLPGMDGFEICRQVQQKGNRGKMGIVIVSAKVDPKDRIEASGLGADAYIVKPFSISELLNVIRYVAKNRKKGEFSVNLEKKDFT